MEDQFSYKIEVDGDWYVALCQEVPGANGQGRTEKEAIESLNQAIALILEDQLEDLPNNQQP